MGEEEVTTSTTAALTTTTTMVSRSGIDRAPNSLCNDDGSKK
ncbi:MAG TPA: hypothetical protein VLW85_17910 [Myxococcales bacterium]|nr:hypothetical protein [Myxococcales bacterium]